MSVFPEDAFGNVLGNSIVAEVSNTPTAESIKADANATNENYQMASARDPRSMSDVMVLGGADGSGNITLAQRKQLADENGTSAPAWDGDSADEVIITGIRPEDFAVYNTPASEWQNNNVFDSYKNSYMPTKFSSKEQNIDWTNRLKELSNEKLRYMRDVHGQALDGLLTVNEHQRNSLYHDIANVGNDAIGIEPVTWDLDLIGTGAGGATLKLVDLAVGKFSLATEKGSVTNSLKISDYTLPNGNVTQVATDGSAIVQLDKVEIFARGGSPDVSQELRELQVFKQNYRKDFDLDPQNEIRLDELKDLNKNFNRSQSMSANLESIGLVNTFESNQLIIQHLLDVGKTANVENRLWLPSILNGPNGSLKVESTWKMINDQQAYLSTLKMKPIY